MSRFRDSPPDLPRTFHFHDLTVECHPEVYDPAEDTFLLLEALQIHPDTIILELGTGCGLIALECARQGARVLCTDINPFAVQLTSRNITCNRYLLKGIVELRQGDLFSVLKKNELFDIILFNPPYLPTKTKEKVGGWFDIATMGGPDGLRVIRRFLSGISHYLLPGGSAYFIFSSLSDRTTLERYLRKYRLSACVISSYLSDDEELNVYRVSPTA